MPGDLDGSGATIREVIALIEGIRKELLAELEKFEQTHRVEHEREGDRRAGYIRWAVTTLMTGIGTLFAVLWAVGHG